MHDTKIGIDFVSSNGPIEVYSSKEESKLPIHEEDETRNEELRKIVKRELLVNIFLPLLCICGMYMAFYVISICSMAGT